MAVKWTKDQLDVINIRKRNTLVSAAAGSGKTAVLVEHIIKLVTDENNPVDIDKILVVTFTRAAAAEMRERILAAIEQQSKLHPENEHLQRQLSYIHNAEITTIDSFCMKVVKEYFNELDMDPGFRMGDEGELKLIMSDVMDEMLEEHYENGTEEFFEFVDEFASGKTDKNISEHVLNLYNFVASRPDSTEWLLNCKKDYSITTTAQLQNSKWVQYFTEYADTILKEQLKKIDRARIICARYSELDAYSTAIDDADGLARRLLKSNFHERYQILCEHEFERMGTVKNVTEFDVEAAKLRVKNTRDEFKEVISALSSDIYSMDEDEVIENIKGCVNSVKVLVDLTLEFIDKFQEKKSEKNIVDFTDIEHFAYKILVKQSKNGKIIPSDIAVELSKKYEEIMIDEYQDSNMLQENILNSISKGNGIPNVFMVGDVKQSIYGFRHADPSLFIEKYNTYKSHKRSLYWKKSLGKNFRSREEVVYSVNKIFERIMNVELTGIAYDKDSRLYVGAQYPELPSYQDQNTEIIYVENKYTGKDRYKYEAHVIIDRINELMNPDKKFQVYDKKQKKYRDIQYKDIVILARDTKNISDIFAEAFMEAGIPMFSERKTGYLDCVEIQTMLNLLTVINNPLDDIPLVSVMRSPIYSFTSTDFAKVCSVNKCEYFYDSLVSYIDSGNDEKLKKKISHFIDKLNSYRDLVPYMPIYDLIEYLYEDTNYYNYVAAMPNGKQKSKNLDVLYGKAVSYDDGSYKGLFKFVKYIENIKKANLDYGEATVLGENDDIVRVMTIHKSKGLQFPVVIVAGLGNSFMTRDLSDSILFDSKMGIGIDNIDSRLKVKSGTLIKSAIKYVRKQEKYAEEMRVLYVALTRAEEKLILVGSQKKVEEKLKRWENSIDSKTVNINSLMQGTSFLDWISAAIKGEADFDNHISITTVGENSIDLLGQIIRSGRMDIDTLKSNDKPADMKVIGEVKKRIDFKYTHKADTMMQSKTSVSKLKVRAMEFNPELDGAMLLHEDTEPAKPEFITGKQKLVGADRGTAYHRIFEIFDFSISPTEENLKNMMDKFYESGKIDDAAYDVVEIKDLVKFASSNLGKRMKKAYESGKLFREQPYVMGLPADSIDSECSSDELVLIQGVIDVCFEEDDCMVIADYKTDNVSNMKQLANRYKVQLEYYEKAITQVAGKKVKEKIIYSVKLGDEISL